MVDAQTISIVFAGLSVGVAAIYYMLTLRNAQTNQELTRKAQEQALDTRQAQLFMGVYNQIQENMAPFTDIVNNWEYKDWDDFQEKYGAVNNPEAREDMLKLNAFLEGVGVLVYRDLISKELVSDLMSGFIVRYWEKYEPYVREVRSRLNWLNAYEHIEYLYSQIEPLYRIKSSRT